MNESTRSCLIIGAGLSGLTAGRVLQSNGWEVLLLDKGRQPGGRMATREYCGSRFDYGAQFFTVRDLRFQQEVEAWQSAGWAAPWFTSTGHTRYRGVQGMNRIAAELSRSLRVHSHTAVDRVLPDASRWTTLTEDGGSFHSHALILTPPPAQSARIVEGCAEQFPPELIQQLAAITYDPCFTLMVVLQDGSHVPEPGYLKPDGGPILSIADNTMKQISGGAAAALTIHAQPGFSREHFDGAQEDVAPLLLNAAKPWIKGAPVAWKLHRWRYSQPAEATAERCLFSAAPSPVVFAGDGFGGPRIEGAFLSGLAAAERLLAAAAGS